MILKTSNRLPWIGVIFLSVKYALAEQCPGAWTMCNSELLCYGAGTGISDDDQKCIVQNGCDSTYRLDMCQQCDRNPSQYPRGSQYMDCKSNCFTPDTVANMLKVDVCGICGGTNSTCNPAVTRANVDVIADNQNTNVKLEGHGFSVPGLEIVIFQRPIRPKRSNNGATIVAKAVIRRLVDASNVEVRIGRLTKGTYIIGARTWPDGTEYETASGPVIYVYAAADYGTDFVTPNAQNLDGTDTLAVNLHLVLKNGLASELTSYHCLVKDYIDGGATAVLEASLNTATALLSCTISVPTASKRSWVCASFNRITGFGCRSIVFYELAPEVVNNKIVFSSSGYTVSVTFNKGAILASATMCSQFFADVSKLGTNPLCSWNREKTSLAVRLGDQSTLISSDTLELVSGFKSYTGAYSRETATITLSVEYPEMTYPLEVAPDGFWPSKLPMNANGFVTLALKIVRSPANRLPSSILWKVNTVIQETGNDKTTLYVAVEETGDYLVEVTARDFLGGSAVITHTIVKLELRLPSVQLEPLRMNTLANGELSVHPYSVFVIGTSIEYVGPRTLYKLQWMRNDENKTGLYTYTSDKLENTKDMCGDSVIYKLRLYTKDDASLYTEAAITVNIVCRHVVAQILGSKDVDVQIGSDVDISVDGSYSFDPDGGELTYAWTCVSGQLNCMKTLKMERESLSSKLTLSPSRMTAGQTYVFTLTVSTVKSEQTYTGIAHVTYNAAAGKMQTVRFVTIRKKFRADVSIMVKAFVGSDVNVEWSLVKDQSDYDWLDLSNRAVGKESSLVKGFAWYIINPNQLKRGRKYMFQVKVSNISNTTLFITQKHELYIYEHLRNCTIKANPITELEKTVLLLENCVKDPDVRKLETSCKIENIDLPPVDDLSFYVPIFKNRLLQRTKLFCEVQDGLGHKIEVESNEVDVTLIASAETKLDYIIAAQMEDGNVINSIEMLSTRLKTAGLSATSENNNKVADLVRQVMDEPLTPNAIKRLLKSVVTLNVDALLEEKTNRLAMDITNLLEKLCNADNVEEEIELSNADIKELIIKAKELAKKEGENTRQYRKIEDAIACIRIKDMENEETEIIEFADGSKHTYMVTTFDDMEKTGLKITFPEEVKRMYRDVWTCKTRQLCHGVGLKVEVYKTGDTPDIVTGRTDISCSIYMVVDLFNQNTGKKIKVDSLSSTINLNFGSKCAHAECWYFEEAVRKFDQSGVVTIPQDDGSVICGTKHLSTFTVKSGPVLYDGINVPVIVAAVLGSLSLVVSLVILIHAASVTKKQSQKVEMEQQRDTEMDTIGVERTPYMDAVYDVSNRHVNRDYK